MSENRRLVRFWAYAALMVFGLAGLGLQETAPRQTTEAEAPEDEPTTTEPATLKGQILALQVNPADVTSGERLRSLRQILIEASEEEAAAIVVELNTNAGYSAELASLLLRDLPNVEVPLVAYAKSSALGMGALLALGSDAIYMSPISVIGGATPEGVGTSGEDESRMSAKDRQTVSILKAQARSLAKANGHQPEVAEAMIDPDFELKSADGAVLSEEGEVLTLTAEEATQIFEGKPLLAKAVANSRDEVISAEKLTGEVVEIGVPEWQRNGFRNKIKPRKTGQTAKSGDEAGEEEKQPPLFGKSEDENYAGKILVVKVGTYDLMSTARFKFMERVVEKAREDKAGALIFDMNTPGGYAWHTKDLTLRPLQELPFPTYTFVNPHAESAGSIIALATDHIYMYPTSTIGSALTVTGAGGDLGENMSKKIEAEARASARNLAIAKGHNPDLAEAFVSTVGFRIDGVTYAEPGEVLNLNAIQATQVFNGEPLLAKGIVRSVEELIETEGLKGEVLEVEGKGLQAFAEWVQRWAVIFIVVGLAGAYMELNTPGFGFAGLVSVLSFTIYFFGNYMAGNMAGYGTAVVFALGLILVIVEVLILGGGTVAVGMIGALLMVGALGFALIDRVDFGDFVKGAESAPSLGGLVKIPMLTVMVGLFLSAVAIGLLMKVLPEFTPARRLILQGALPTGTAMDLEVDESTGKSPLLGKTGVAATDLHPAGKADIGGRMLDVTSESEFIERGEKLKVAAVFGDRIVVDRG